MNKDEDPTTLFEQINSITNRYSMTTIHDGDLLAVVLDAATKECYSIFTAEQRFKRSKLEHSDLESAMNQHWRQNCHVKSEINYMIIDKSDCLW